MADDHSKFVLKERQKLEARAKKLDKQEAEFHAVKEQNVALEADLRAKTAQLAQTADLLRKRDEERDAARREAASARQQLEAARAEAAAAKASAMSTDRQERIAREASARAESAEALAGSQRDAAKSAQEAADEARAALEATVQKMREVEEALNEREQAVLALQRNAKRDEAELAAARAELAAQRRAMEQTQSSADGLRQVLSLALARHLVLLQALHKQQSALSGTQADLAQLEELRRVDAGHMAALRRQLEAETASHEATVSEERSLAQALRQELDRLHKADDEKRETIARLEAAAAEGEKAAAATMSELEGSRAQLDQAQTECASLQSSLEQQSKDLATSEARCRTLEEQLAERMRWIESLETSQTVHRKKIEELYEQLRLVLSLGHAADAAAIAAAREGGTPLANAAAAPTSLAASAGDLADGGVGSGVAQAARTAAADLEASLMAAEVAGLNERIRFLTAERAQFLEASVSSAAIQQLIDHGARAQEAGIGGIEHSGGPAAENGQVAALPLPQETEGAGSSPADGTPPGVIAADAVAIADQAAAASDGGGGGDAGGDAGGGGVDEATAVGQLGGSNDLGEGEPPTSVTSGGDAEPSSSSGVKAHLLEQRIGQLQEELSSSRQELSAKDSESDELRARAATAEGRAQELERKLRQQAQSTTARASKAAAAASSDGGERTAALKAELLAKQKEVEAKDAELALLKDMVRARKSDARTRELKQEVQTRRRIRTDAPPAGGGASAIEVSPTSSSTTPARRAPAVNTMQRLNEG